MPHPVNGYRNKIGEKVPGVTTVLGRWKESGGLIQWAYKRGKDGLELYESRDKAAELGTIVHEMVEQFISGTPPTMPELNEVDTKAVMSAYEAFGEWWDSNQFQVIEQEIQLVSEKYQFGGTPDAIVRDGKDRLCLCDWKTSDGVYQEYLVQIAAYRILWNENYPDNQLTGGSHLCRFSKQHGDFAHHFFPNLDEAERLFVLLREAYDIDKILKKRC